MSERIAAGAHLNTSLRAWLAVELQTQRTWRVGVAALHSHSPEILQSSVTWLEYLPSVDLRVLISVVKPWVFCFPPLRRAGLKKEWAYAPLGCFEEVGGWGKYDRWCCEKNTIRVFERAWNSAGPPCKPAPLPTCSLRWLRCSLSACLMVSRCTAPLDASKKAKERRPVQL